MLKKIITFFFAFIISICSSYAATTLEANYTLGETGWDMRDTKYSKANSLRDLSGNNHGLVNWGGAPGSSGATTATPALTSTASITALGAWASEAGSDSLFFGALTRYVVRFDVKMTDVKNQILWSIGDVPSNNGLVIKTDDNGILSLAQYRGDVNVVGSSFTMTKDTWVRVIMYVNNNVATLYVNGSRVLSYTATNATLSKMKFCAVDGMGASATSSVVDELSIWKFDEADTFASVWQTVNAHRLSDPATIPATPQAPLVPEPPAPPQVDPDPFEGTSIDILNNDLIRNAQSNGAAKKNKNYTGGGLVIAGNSYADGVGQCAPAMMPLTIPAQRGKKTIFRGRVGVDDAGTGDVRFHILSGTKTLWSSNSMSKGAAAESFEVTLPAGCTKVYLMTTGSGYANWVSLRYDYATDDTVYPVNPIILGEEFGIRPDVESDQSAALANALDRLRACGGGTLSLSPGTYHFYVSGSHKMRFHVSNHEQTAGNEFDVVGVHPISIPLIDLRNVTLEGNGSTFIFHGRGLPWVVMDSENIEVKNIISDHKRMYYSEAKVVGKNGDYPIVTIDENEFPYTLSGGNSEFAGTFTFNGGGSGEGETWTLGAGIYLHFQKYTDDSGRECYRIYPGTTDNEYTGGVNSVATVNGVKQLKLDISRAQIAVGDVLMLRTWARPHPGCFIYRSKDTVFNNVQIASAFGMAWLAQMSENILISGGGTFPRPSTGRVYSGCVDSTHFVNCKGQVTVENGLFCNMMDDAINVHNTSLKVTSKSGNTIVCNFGHPQAVGFDPIQVGDTIRFLDRPAMVYRDTAKVTAVEKTGTWSISLTLDRAVPAFVATGEDAIENVDYQPNVTFSGSIIRGNRARGALFTSPRKVICENNKFLWVSGAAIQFAGDAGSWFESGGTRDAIVRGNVFDNCFTSNYGNASGVITIFPTNFDAYYQSGATGRYHQNIVIENNTFKTFQTPMLHSLSGSYLKFINNKVYFNAKPDGAVQPYGTNPFNFSYSDDILISGNRVFDENSNTFKPQNWTLDNCTYSNTTNIVFDQPSYDVWSSVRFPSDTTAEEKALDATPAKDEIINLEKFVFDADATIVPTKPAGAFGRQEIFTTGAGTEDEKDYFKLRFPYNSAAGEVTLSAECLDILNNETPAWTSDPNKILLEKNETEIVITLQTPISAGPSKQAVRLKGTLDGKTFTTEAYGYELIPIPASTTTKFGLRVHKPFIFQKEISIGTTDLPFEVGTETNIDKVKFTDADLFAKIETGKSYIVEILTNGEVEGKRVSAPFIVNRSVWRGFNNTVKDEVAKTVTFDCTNLAAYLRDSTNVNAVVGYRIREASTLLDVFGPAAGSNLKAGTSRTADIVKYHILDKNLWSFYVDSGNKWNSGSLKGENVTTGNAPIFYHRPIQVQRRGTSDISYILTGEVLTEEQKVHVYKSDANISSGLLFGDSETTISKPESESDVQIKSKL